MAFRMGTLGLVTVSLRKSYTIEFLLQQKSAELFHRLEIVGAVHLHVCAYLFDVVSPAGGCRIESKSLGHLDSGLQVIQKKHLGRIEGKLPKDL